MSLTSIIWIRFSTVRRRLSKEKDLGLCVGHRALAAMTALQELSVRLSLFTRSLPLSTLRESAGHLYRRRCSVHVRVSASSSSLPTVADSYFPVPLLSRGSYRHLSAGADDLKLGALARSDLGSSIADDLSFGDSKISDDDVDSPTPQRLFSDDSDETDDTKASSDSAQFGASGYVQYVQEGPTKAPQSPNYLTMSDKQLFSKCRMDTYRASGPGGQHRNKTDSAVRLTHIPTGLVSQAADDRSQHLNRSLALTRLRQVIALEVRDPVKLDGYKPPPELVRVLPSGTEGKRGNSQRIGPNHPDFILGMKALMDLLYATGGSVSDTGKILGLTTGALSKLITSNNLLWQGVNKLRSLKGLKPLR